MVASHAAPSGVCNPTPRILASPNRVDGDLFGASVAVDNDTLVVGIPGINTQSALRLEVYKYNAGADDWVFDQPLGNLCAVENRRYSVAWLRLCGNNIFVLGGYISDKCNATLTWFRRRSSTDDFVFMSSNAFGGEIGSMISCQVTPLGVTRIAIGMIGGYVTDDPILWPGRVTLWEENGGTITRVANISGTSIGVDPSTNFGHPALVQGDFVFVGARYTNVNGNMQAGTVHQFSWAAQPTHKALVPTSPPFELGAKGSQYGVALAFGGNSTLFVVGNTVFPSPGTLNPNEERGQLVTFASGSADGVFAPSQVLTREGGRGHATVVARGSHALAYVSGFRIDANGVRQYPTSDAALNKIPTHVHLLRQNASTGLWDAVNGFFESNYAHNNDEYGGLFAGNFETWGMQLAPISGDVMIGAPQRDSSDAAGTRHGTVFIYRCAEVKTTTVTTPTSAVCSCGPACGEKQCDAMPCANRARGWNGNSCMVFSNNAAPVAIPCNNSMCGAVSIDACSTADAAILRTCKDAACINTTACQSGALTPDNTPVCLTNGESCGANKKCGADGECSIAAATAISSATIAQWLGCVALFNLIVAY